MKKKMLAVLMCTATPAPMLVGCGGKKEEASAPAEAPAKEEAPAAEAAPEEAAPEAEAETAKGGDYTFEIIVKSYQSSYWQAAVTGVNQAAADLGVTANCTGPNAESDIADQVNMLNSAINNTPDGIGLAACDQDACLDP